MKNENQVKDLSSDSPVDEFDNAPALFESFDNGNYDDCSTIGGSNHCPLAIGEYEGFVHLDSTARAITGEGRNGKWVLPLVTVEADGRKFDASIDPELGKQLEEGTLVKIEVSLIKEVRRAAVSEMASVVVNDTE